MNYSVIGGIFEDLCKIKEGLSKEDCKELAKILLLKFQKVKTDVSEDKVKRMWTKDGIKSFIQTNDKVFCSHKYAKVNELYDYWDYSGFHVHVFKCRCQKCGKVKNRKFY